MDTATVIEIEGFRRERDLLWPMYDRECARAVFGETAKLAPVVELCKKRDVVVQAGGNCGVFPLALSQLFGNVYTFEPDPANFVALAVNTANVPNIVKMQAALGDKPQLVGLINDENENCGSLRITFKGIVPTLRIDDLGLFDCDLIYLDIEGRELSALMGARKTIQNKKPVIVIEDKGLSSHYGVPQGAAVLWLQETFNYRVHSKLARDVVLVPAD
jgi:FkbM family methyltransferase